MSVGWAWVCVAATVTLTAVGQFLIKWQVLKAGPLPDGLSERAAYVWHLLLNPWIVAALVAAFVAAVSWMMAMTRLPLTHAYPLTALTFVLVVFGGSWAFREPLTPLRIGGALLIAVGLVVGGRG